MKGSSEAHTRLVSDARLRFGAEPDLVLWSNSKVTMVRGVPVAKPGLQVGASDIIGVLRMPSGVGRFCAFEAKTGGARASAAQRRFQELVRGMGGFACTFRSVEEFWAALQRARLGEDS